jgi:hypothetical protein
VGRGCAIRRTNDAPKARIKEPLPRSLSDQVEGFFEFKKDGQGEFHFGYVHGFIDYRLGTRDGNPCAEFTWEGNDEMDSAMGRGWAVIDGDEIEGMLFFHQGDESGFKAERKK